MFVALALLTTFCSQAKAEDLLPHSIPTYNIPESFRYLILQSNYHTKEKFIETHMKMFFFYSGNSNSVTSDLVERKITRILDNDILRIVHGYQKLDNNKDGMLTYDEFLSGESEKIEKLRNYYVLEEEEPRETLLEYFNTFFNVPPNTTPGYMVLIRKMIKTHHKRMLEYLDNPPDITSEEALRTLHYESTTLNNLIVQYAQAVNYDLDKDGFITNEEIYQSHYTQELERNSKKTNVRALEALMNIDPDQNGELTADEYKTLLATYFQALDKNFDGKVIHVEIHVFTDKFKRKK